MLDSNELVSRLAGFDKSHVQTHFQFLRNHTSSITHCRGCPALRACVNTNSTLVHAISLENTPHTPLPWRCTESMICVAVSRSLLKYSWMMATTNSIGV